MTPHQISQLCLAATGIRTFTYYPHRLPQQVPAIVVSNHRSFLDPLALMCGTERSLRTACHHYLGQVPGVRDFVRSLGCFPLAQPERRYQSFFAQATDLLRSGQWVCVFPEGAQPMVELTSPWHLCQFQRGFAHLALRADVPRLAVLPVAIASLQETVTSTVPIRLLRWFDPSEELFNRPGRHPLVVYQRLNVVVGRPFWIGPNQRRLYRSKQNQEMVTRVNQHCRQEIARLLRQHRQLAIAPPAAPLT